MKNHQKQRKFTLVFDGIRVAFSHPLGLTEQTSATIDLGTYAKLITDITKDFSPYDAPKDAIYEMKELKMGNNTSIEEHVSKFKMLVTQSKLAKNDAVTEYFRESLPIALQKNVHQQNVGIHRRIYNGI